MGNAGRTRKGTSASDLEDRTLGVGDPTSASRDAGKRRSRWARVDLTGGGSVAGTVKEYDVQHDLGEVPTTCTLEFYSNPGNSATVISATATRRENWSHSHCHVLVSLVVAGSLDGCTADFLVSGR